MLFLGKTTHVPARRASEFFERLLIGEPTMRLSALAFGATLAAAVATIPSRGRAQSAQDCSVLMKSGIYDRFNSLSTESHYSLVKDFFRNNQFSSRQQASSKAVE